MLHIIWSSSLEFYCHFKYFFELSVSGNYVLGVILLIDILQVVPYLLKFIDSLTNVYVRFNRKRLKGRTGDNDCRIALSTLYYVCNTLARLDVAK